MVIWLIREANHGLPNMSAGRTLKYNYIHDLIYHALLQAGLPSTKNLQVYFALILNGLMALPTYVPWQAGKSAARDVRVADTLADSYLTSTSMTAAAAAELAATRNEAKYVALSTIHRFVPLAFDSLGPIGTKATHFLKNSVFA